ncbi:hypothetical protein ACLX1H_008210 [Fusarium chlamydosporum]
MDNIGYLSRAQLSQSLKGDVDDGTCGGKEIELTELVGNGTPQEISYAIDLCQCIAEFEEDEPIKSTDKLVAHLLNSTFINDTEVLERVIQFSRELYEDPAVEDDCILLNRRANNYGKALGDRYWQRGARDDLDESIRLAEEAVTASPQALSILNNPRGITLQQPGLEVHTLNTLAARLDERFQLTGSLRCLKRSIYIMERLILAVDGPNWDDARLEWSGNLAASLQRLYEQSDKGDTGDMNRVVDIYRDILQAMVPDGSQRSKVLLGLGNALAGRHLVTRRLQDLDESIRLLSEARDITSTTDPMNIEVGYNLALRLFQRRVSNDIEEAIRIAESTIQYTDNVHPVLPHLQNLLGALHYEIYVKELPDSKERAKRALELWWKALNSDCYPSVLYRVQAGRRILHLCCELQNWQAAYTAAVSAVELIPKLSMREIRNSDKQRLLSTEDVVGFSSDAAAAALNAGKSAFDVVQLLEMGRGSLASSVAELRTDLTSLRREYPTIAKQFTDLRDQLGAESHGQARASKEFDTLLSVIRQKPGFENFLKPISYQNVLDAACDGPIIILNQSKYRRGIDVITIKRDQMYAMNLEVSLEDINMSPGHLQDLDFLERLWNSVAKPILEALEIGLPSPGAALPRIWWIPTGALGRLPFHAAGNHFANVSDSVIDRAVSSYSSSIKMLLETRKRASSLLRPQSQGALLVGMSNTRHCASLPFAIKELQQVKKLFDEQKAFGSMLLHNEAAVKQKVLEHLKNCSIFHFAGHAMENASDPLRSTLLLHDHETDPMSVESLLEVNLSEESPFLAFLAACKTGNVTTSRFQDESIHLVAAYQLAGFRHVIGSLWSVEDQASMKVADETYKNLLQGMMEDRVSRSLHEATRKLRDDARLVHKRGNDSEPRDVVVVDSDGDVSGEKEGNWVPFVHFGI